MYKFIRILFLIICFLLNFYLPPASAVDNIIRISKSDIINIESWKKDLKISEDVFFVHLFIDAATATSESLDFDFKMGINYPGNPNDGKIFPDFLTNLYWIESNRVVILIEGLFRNVNKDGEPMQNILFGYWIGLDYALGLRNYKASHDYAYPPFDGKKLEIYATD
jgi:hypothetical protein